MVQLTEYIQVYATTLSLIGPRSAPMLIVSAKIQEMRIILRYFSIFESVLEK